MKNACDEGPACQQHPFPSTIAYVTTKWKQSTQRAMPGIDQIDCMAHATSMPRHMRTRTLLPGWPSYLSALITIERGHTRHTKQPF